MYFYNTQTCISTTLKTKQQYLGSIWEFIREWNGME